MRRNPFRREADAFRLLSIIGVAAGAVIAVAVLIGSLAGALLGLALLLAGVVQAWRWVREGLQEPPE
jgi:hypothetical protein